MTEILINQNDRRIQYTATAGQTVFPYDFPVYANTELTVIRNRAGTITTRTLTTDFTVSGVGAEGGGNVTLTAGASLNDQYTIYGTTPYERTTDYGTGGDFKAATVNKDFDRLAIMAQQLDTRVSRALSLNISDSSTPLQFSIQTTVARESGILSFSSDGTKVETVRTLTDFDSDVSDASDSAAAAATSESNAANSASSASASATAAATSATNAANSASAAATSATNAANSATAASGSATAAATSATNASNSATSASASATTATTQATNASNSASAAATSETNAAASASSAATSATNAATSATNAAASATAAASSAAALRGTSTTSLAIGTGTKTFTTQAGKQFNVGQFVIVVSDASPATNYMFGQITAYAGTSLDVNVTVIGGAGTHTDWTIYVSGAQGATGAAGSLTIAAAGGTADALTADFTPDVALADKTVVAVVAASANATTTPTFAPDGLTAHTITKFGGQALVAGDIRAAGHVLLLEYNLAGTRWELLNPVFTQTSVTGNAGTATALQTSRTINGTGFDGTANITVTAAAGSLTGTTLNATVVSSSLTSVGTIATGVWNGTSIAVANGGTGATTAFTARANLGVDRQLNSKTADYTVTTTDNNWMVELTGAVAHTFSFTAAATMGNGWSSFIHNNSTAILTLDPNGAELIDGLSTLTMYPGEHRLVTCSGTAFTSKVIKGFAAQFDSSGSLIKPPGYTTLQVDVWHSGQSGAARLTTGNAGGGGGGGYAQFTIPSSAFVAAGSSETITIAATSAGVTGNTNGNARNLSSFTVNGVQVPAALVNSVFGGDSVATQIASASAAVGGLTAAVSGASSISNGGYQNQEYYLSGGAVTTGNVPSAGMAGFASGGSGGGCSSTAGGTRTGGISIWGGAGGAGGANTGGNGTNGTAPGGGGGGAVQGGTSGSGAPGRIIVRGII